MRFGMLSGNLWFGCLLRLESARQYFVPVVRVDHRVVLFGEVRSMD